MSENNLAETGESLQPAPPSIPEGFSGGAAEIRKAHGYPYFRDTATGTPLDKIEQRLTVIEPVSDGQVGEKTVTTNYSEVVDTLLSQLSQVPETNKEQSIDQLNQLEERVRYFGDYLKKDDPIFNLTKRHKHQHLLLMAIEARRAQVMQEANRNEAESGSRSKEPDIYHRRELRSTVKHDTAIAQEGGDLVGYFEKVNGKTVKNTEQMNDLYSFTFIADTLMDIPDETLGKDSTGNAKTYREVFRELSELARDPKNTDTSRKLVELRREFYRNTIDSLKKANAPLVPGDVPVTPHEKLLRQMRLKLNDIADKMSRGAVEELVNEYKGVGKVIEKTEPDADMIGTRDKMRELLTPTTPTNLFNRALKGGEFMYRRSEYIPKEKKYNVPTMIFDKEEVEAPQSLSEFIQDTESRSKPQETVRQTTDQQPAAQPRSEPDSTSTQVPAVQPVSETQPAAQPVNQQVELPQTAPAQAMHDELPSDRVEAESEILSAPAEEEETQLPIAPQEAPEPTLETAPAETGPEQQAELTTAPHEHHDEHHDQHDHEHGTPVQAKFKDGFVLAAAASRNRLEDQIKAQARHLRAEVAAPRGIRRFLANFAPRALQNRLLRAVFESREMRFAADLDLIAKKRLGISESVPLDLGTDFALKAIEEGRKDLNNQRWIKRWSKKLFYLTFRFISGTTGIIQSPDQWEARRWLKNSLQGENLLKQTLERSLKEQDNLGNRFGLVSSGKKFEDIDAARIEQDNSHILSGEKGETRHLYDLPDTIQAEIKRNIAEYAQAPIHNKEEEFAAKSRLLTEVNLLLQKGVFNNHSIIADRSQRRDLISAEVASNILSIAEEIRKNKGYYLENIGEDRTRLDELPIKFLAGKAWWGKARQAEATGVFGKSFNESMASRLADRNYRWGRSGHKALNIAANWIKDAGLFSTAYGAGTLLAGGRLVVGKGKLALIASPLGLVGGAAGVGALNALQETGLVKNVRGRLYGIGGNYLQEYVQYSHEAALGRENPQHAKIRNEMERISVTRMSAEQWIADVKKLINDDVLFNRDQDRNVLIGLLADAKARMRLTDISSRKEGIRLAAVQNFIQYQEGKENEQAFEMHSLLLNGIAKLANSYPRDASKISNMSLVREAQLRIGDDINAIIEAIDDDLHRAGKPSMMEDEIRDLHDFLHDRGLTVDRNESLDAKNRLLVKLSRRKALRAGIGTGITTAAFGVLAPLVGEAVEPLSENVGHLFTGISDIFNAKVPPVSQLPSLPFGLNHVVDKVIDKSALAMGKAELEIQREYDEWRHILGDRSHLPVYVNKEASRPFTDMNGLQSAVLQAREYIDPIKGPGTTVQVNGTTIQLPAPLKYVFDSRNPDHAGILDMRTGEVLDLSRGRELVEDHGQIGVKNIDGSISKISDSFSAVHVHATAPTVIPQHTPSEVTTVETHSTVPITRMETVSFKGEEGLKAWNDMSTRMDHGERFWNNNTRGSDGTELRLFNRVEDTAILGEKAVILKFNPQDDDAGFARLGDSWVDTNALVKNNKILFTFRLAGHYDEPIIVQATNGELRLDPTDTGNFMRGPDGNFLIMNGGKVSVADFSKMVLNKEVLRNIHEGSLASEYTDRLEVFKLQPEVTNKSGFIGAYFKSKDGTYNSLAQIRGRGTFEGIELVQNPIITTQAIQGTALESATQSQSLQTPFIEYTFKAKPLEFEYTYEPWFVPLYARQNIERSVVSDKKDKKEQKPTETQAATQTPPPPTQQHAPQTDEQKTEEEHVTEQTEAPGVPPVPPQVKQQQVQDSQKKLEESLNQQREVIDLRTRIQRDELQQKIQDTPELRERLERNRERLKTVEEQITVTPTIQINRTADQIREEYLDYSNKIVPELVRFLRSDIQNLRDGEKGMTLDIFIHNWGMRPEEAERLLNTNNEKIAVTNQMHNRFIRDLLVDDELSKYPPEEQRKFSEISERLFRNQTVSDEERRFRGTRLHDAVTKAQHRFGDWLGLSNKITEWDIEELQGRTQEAQSQVSVPETRINIKSAEATRSPLEKEAVPRASEDRIIRHGAWGGVIDGAGGSIAGGKAADKIKEAIDIVTQGGSFSLKNSAGEDIKIQIPAGGYTFEGKNRLQNAEYMRDLAANLNRLVRETQGGAACFAFGQIYKDSEGKLTLTYSSLGDSEIAIIKIDGTVSLLPNKSIRELSEIKGDIDLYLSEREATWMYAEGQLTQNLIQTVNTGNIDLEQGDRVVYLTDGIAEDLHNIRGTVDSTGIHPVKGSDGKMIGLDILGSIPSNVSIEQMPRAIFARLDEVRSRSRNQGVEITRNSKQYKTVVKRKIVTVASVTGPVHIVVGGKGSTTDRGWDDGETVVVMEAT